MTYQIKLSYTTLSQRIWVVTYNDNWLGSFPDRMDAVTFILNHRYNNIIKAKLEA